MSAAPCKGYDPSGRLMGRRRSYGRTGKLSIESTVLTPTVTATAIEECVEHLYAWSYAWNEGVVRSP